MKIFHVRNPTSVATTPKFEITTRSPVNRMIDRNKDIPGVNIITGVPVG